MRADGISGTPSRPKSRAAWRARLASPAVLLWFLAPTIGELLSGSSPPVAFFNPIYFVTQAALYGNGALIVRELTFRWRRGWPTILVLGLAYGIVEEGLMVKSFFDPAWKDLGALAWYGRLGGVNAVWAVQLDAYHAIFSIAIPILLVGLVFPDRRGQPWVGRRAFRLACALLAGDVAFGAIAFPYRPPIGPYIAAMMLAGVLIFAARRLPPSRGFVPPIARGTSSRAASSGVARRRTFLLLGFAGTLGWFLITGISPGVGLPPAAAVAMLLLLVSRIAWLVRRLSNRGAWSDAEVLALTSGGLLLFAVFDVIQEVSPTHGRITTGMSLVGLAAVLMLGQLARRTRTRLAAAAQVGVHADESRPNLPMIPE